MPKISSEWHDPASLQRVANDIKEIVRKIEVLIASMEAQGIARLSISYQAELITAIPGLDKWIDDGLYKLREHLQARGDYRAANMALEAEKPDRKRTKK